MIFNYYTKKIKQNKFEIYTMVLTFFLILILIYILPVLLIPCVTITVIIIENYEFKIKNKYYLTTIILSSNDLSSF